MVEASEPTGFDMLREGSGMLTMHELINGNIDAAVQNALERLSEPVSASLWRGRKSLTDLYGPLYSDPRIIASINERETALAQLRVDVENMLLQPEWRP